MIFENGFQDMQFIIIRKNVIHKQINCGDIILRELIQSHYLIDRI